MSSDTSPTPVSEAIAKLVDSTPLGAELTQAAFAQLMRGEATPAQTAALLLGLRMRGETAEELAGAVRALRAAMVRVEPNRRAHLIDTCGTGGGAVTTFNISTAAALVAAGAGASVAKHGNRSYTSQCGSADVLEQLGLDIGLGADAAAALLDSTGMAFLFAPAFHPAIRHVAPVRRDLAVPTIMNLIGPLANPAGVDRQVVGVADPERGPLIAHALLQLGATHALVVHGRVGMDEIAPAGTTAVWEVASGEIRHWDLDPKRCGVEPADCDRLRGGNPEENAARIERLLDEPSGDAAGSAAVTLNAGAAVYVAGLERTLARGIERARSALTEGKAATVLAGLREAGGVSTSA